MPGATASTPSARSSRAAGALTAYVLHRYDWSESSVILDLYTREQGRLAVAAKGAKRPHSQLRSVLLPFQRLHVSLGRVPKQAEDGDGGADARAEVHNLRAAEWAAGASMLTGAALFSGFYANELLMKLLPRHDAHPRLFDAYDATLPELRSEDDGAVQSALRAFELTLLQQIGLLPDLSMATLTLEAVDPGRGYGLLPESGVGEARGQGPVVAGRTLVGLQAALQHGSLAALRQECSKALPELRPVLRALLHYHLGSPVLRTRQVMLDLQAMVSGPAR